MLMLRLNDRLAEISLRKNHTIFMSQQLSLNRNVGRTLKYSKTCVKQSLKKDKTMVLMATGSLMKVESIAECSIGILE